MQFHALDPLLLSRAGQVLQALCRWFAQHPTDRHPTVDQLAAAIQSNRKFVSRGLKDLAGAGLILLTLDLGHDVGRSIDLAPHVAHLVAEAIAATAEAGTEVGRQARSVGTEVAHLRSEEIPSEVDVVRRQATCVPGGGGGGTSPEPGSIGDALQRLHGRLVADLGQQIAADLARPKLADVGHLEYQRRLPIEAPSRPDPNLKLMTAVGRLEVGGTAGIAAIEPAVLKMVEHFGADFRPVYDKVSRAVALGRFTLAPLVATLEEASRQGVKHPGAAFAAAAVRNFPGLIFARKPQVEPAPGPSAKIFPGAGQELAPAQSSLA